MISVKMLTNVKMVATHVGKMDIAKIMLVVSVVYVTKDWILFRKL